MLEFNWKCELNQKHFESAEEFHVLQLSIESAIMHYLSHSYTYVHFGITGG